MPSNQLRNRRILWLLALTLGLALRFWFLHHPMPLDDDTDVYSELANNLFHHGIYGLADNGVIQPTLIRLPGYPLFLALIFFVFGQANFHAVLLTQILIDLLGCWLIASFVREQFSERAGTIAIFLAALCPFTAAYTTIALTESLSIFSISLALWACGRILRGRTTRSTIALTALGMAMAMLLRPDGILLSAAVVIAVVWYQRRVKTTVILIALTILPFIPWMIRNAHTFHVFQPLAPRRVSDPGERVNYGFYHWINTWSVDIVSTGNVFWQVDTAAINVNDLPSRAFDSAAQYQTTARLLADYNQKHHVTPELDARFQQIADARLHAHPFLCRVWVPLLRVGDMWLRPRTETLGLDADWWRYDLHHDESIQAIILGLLNLALITAAFIGFVRRRVPFAVLPLTYIVLRSLLLSTMENSEPRYTLEAFPFLLAAAAVAFAGSQLRTFTPRETEISSTQQL